MIYPNHIQKAYSLKQDIDSSNRGEILTIINTYNDLELIKSKFQDQPTTSFVDSSQELLFIYSPELAFNLIAKARKGTPEYDIWLRKYREKRAAKQVKLPSEIKSIKEKTSEIIKKKKQLLDLIEKPVNLKPEIREKESAAPKTSSNSTIDHRESLFSESFGKHPVIPIETGTAVTTPAEFIPVQLGTELESIPDKIWEDDVNWKASEKVDGARATLIITKEAVRVTARPASGKNVASDYTNHVPHIRDLDLYSILGDTVIDSEAVATNPVEVKKGEWADALGSTMAILSPRMDPAKAIAKQNKFGRIINKCFDIQRYKGEDLRAKPWQERQEILKRALDEIKHLSKDISKVSIQAQGETKKQFYDRVATFDGEGLVLAKTDAPYVANSRNNLIKAKRTLEYTLQIMGVEEGKGRNKNKAGAFMMGAYINGKLTKVAQLNVGDDALRAKVWANPDAYIGKQIEVKSMQWSPTGDSLRHPRWKTPGILREDKLAPDDVSLIVSAVRKKRFRDSK